jgi:hypothetical protein
MTQRIGGYAIFPGYTIDGTNPDAAAAALRRAGFHVTRMPQSLRSRLEFPLNDWMLVTTVFSLTTGKSSTRSAPSFVPTAAISSIVAPSHQTVSRSRTWSTTPGGTCSTPRDTGRRSTHYPTRSIEGNVVLHDSTHMIQRWLMSRISGEEIRHWVKHGGPTKGKGGSSRRAIRAAMADLWRKGLLTLTRLESGEILGTAARRQEDAPVCFGCGKSSGIMMEYLVYPAQPDQRRVEVDARGLLRRRGMG